MVEPVNEENFLAGFSKEQLISFGYGVLWVVVSFCFFRALQFLVRWYLFGKWSWRTFSYFGLRNRNNNRDAGAPAERDAGDSRDLSSVPPNKKWRICNEVVSLIHSVISGLWAAYALLYYKELVSDLLNYRCEVGINLIFMSTGYLLHDLIDLLVNEQSARIIELLFHHVVVLTAFGITMISQQFLGVVVFGLLMELNSIFLHSRSLLNLYGVDKKSQSFRLIALLNMVTLFAFRLCVSCYLMYFVISSLTVIEWYKSIINGVVILSLFITNSVLTYRLLSADGLLGKKRVRKTPATTAETQVDDVEAGALTTENEEEEEHRVHLDSCGRPVVEDATQTV